MRRVDAIAIYMLVLALPFNGIRPVLDLGELSSEGFFYGSIFYLLCTIPLLIARGARMLGPASVLLNIQSVYIAVILVFSAINIETVLGNAYGARAGTERLGLSLLTYGYYFVLSSTLIAHALHLGIERFLDITCRAFTLLGAGLVMICSLEAASWFAEPLHRFLTAMRARFALDAHLTLFRLSGVSHEPSFNAFALLACLPFAALRAAISRRRRFWLLAGLLAALAAISGARTAYLGLAAMAVALLLYWGVRRRALPPGLSGGLLVSGAFVLGLALPALGYVMIDPASPVSNVTRSYLTARAIEAGLVHLWGQGFGQAGFYVVTQTSALIQLSWELTDFYSGARHGVLPPLFSWYARSFGEFGVMGYCLIGAGFALVAARFFTRGAAAGRSGRQLFFLGALFMGQMLAIALSIERLRIPQFWFAWIFAALLFCRPQADTHQRPSNG